MHNEKNLYKINNQTVNKIFSSAAIIAILCIILAYFRESNFYSGMTTYTYPLFFVFIIITIFRKKIPQDYKVYFTLFTIFFVLIVSLLTHGILSSLKIFIVGIPIVISYISTYKKALLGLFISISIYLTFAILFSNNIIEYRFDLTEYSSNIFPWLYDIIMISMVAWMLLIISNNYSDSLIEKNKHIRDQNIILADQKEKYQRLFDDASIAIILIRPNHSIFDCNKTACQLLKISKEELLNKTIDYFNPEYQSNNIKSQQLEDELLSLVLNGYPQKFEWKHINNEKKSFFASVALDKIQLSGDIYIQSIFRDISDQKRKDIELEMYKNHLEKIVHKKTNDLKTANQKLLESNKELNRKSRIINKNNTELKNALLSLKETQAQLLHSEKMASLGTLTAGVAHEINNPLNYIKGAHSGLSQYFKEFGSNDIENTDILLYSIDTGINRATEIVKGLNQFSRKNESLNEKCNIHSILNNCLIILHNRIKQHISIKKEYSETPIIIDGNVGKLHQVFVNILSNANYAIKDSGEIKLKTSIDKDNYIIEILDNGCGMDKNVMSQVYDPFFTTKPPGEGTGIGLYITSSIIREHNGLIKFDSEVGKGTKVSIKFPVNGNNTDQKKSQ